jgi:hypothetical protein
MMGHFDARDSECSLRLLRAFNAAEALEHTKVITNWDDDIYNSVTTLHRETLDFDIERWKVYVETGKFPPRATSADYCIIYASPSC